MISLQTILSALTGRTTTALDVPIRSVVIDSRQAGKNSLFIALPGERVDGHAYVQDAFDNGAILALVEQDLPYSPNLCLDYNAKQALKKVFVGWRNEGKSILLVTHDVEFAALLADRVAILDDGSILFDGDPRIAFSQIQTFMTKTAQIFPQTNWITPGDVKFRPK